MLSLSFLRREAASARGEGAAQWYGGSVVGEGMDPCVEGFLVLGGALQVLGDPFFTSESVEAADGETSVRISFDIQTDYQNLGQVSVDVSTTAVEDPWEVARRSYFKAFIKLMEEYGPFVGDSSYSLICSKRAGFDRVCQVLEEEKVKVHGVLGSLYEICEVLVVFASDVQKEVVGAGGGVSGVCEIVKSKVEALVKCSDEQADSLHAALVELWSSRKLGEEMRILKNVAAAPMGMDVELSMLGVSELFKALIERMYGLPPDVRTRNTDAGRVASFMYGTGAQRRLIRSDAKESVQEAKFNLYLKTFKIMKQTRGASIRDVFSQALKDMDAYSRDFDFKIDGLCAIITDVKGQAGQIQSVMSDLLASISFTAPTTSVLFRSLVDIVADVKAKCASIVDACDKFCAEKRYRAEVLQDVEGAW